MAEDSRPASPSRGVIALHSEQWQPILQATNQVVLYNPQSHALSVSRSTNHLPSHSKACPYCRRTLPDDFVPDVPLSETYDEPDAAHHVRTSDYFQLLAAAHETASLPPPLAEHESDHCRRGNGTPRTTFPHGTMAEGYFKAFFKEECKLGMGANGTVYLCQHVLDGNPLGYFAVKKIAVGDSHSYLVKILREVRLLVRLHHPNIVTYHHAWLEKCQFSSFGPEVPTLHVLMEWAEGGSLDDFIDVRLGRRSPHVHINPLDPFSASHNVTTPNRSVSEDPFLGSEGSEIHSRSARIRAFRDYQRASPEEKERLCHRTLLSRGNARAASSLKAVHLLSADEVKSLFRDVVEGLNFLHERSILHLDLKPGNVLLTWDEGKLIPRALLSDFGTSRDMIASKSVRSGNTGTLEYSSPESLPSPQTGLLNEIDSKSDMWSLGMILHKLLFFKLPYRYAADGDNDESLTAVRPAERQSKIDDSEKLKRLEQEVLNYPGFKSNPDLVKVFETRRLPRTFLLLLEGLLNKTPNTRPSCDRVSNAIKDGKLDPLQPDTKDTPRNGGLASLVPLARSLFGVNEQERERERGAPSTAQPEPGPDRVDGDDALELRSKQGATMLGLPSPSQPGAEEDHHHKHHKHHKRPLSLKETIFRTIVLDREPLSRFLKSAILVVKVLSISSICPNSFTYGIPHFWVSSLLIGAALIDAVLPMHFISHLGFVISHVIVITMGCANSRCCP